MEEAYVTLAEAAELEEMKYNTMVIRMSRNQQTYDTKTIKSETGGRDTVMVKVSSLSKKARNAYQERLRLQQVTEGQELDISSAPWYVTSDPEWYMAAYKQNYYKGIELRNIVRKFLQQAEGSMPGGKTEYAEQFAREYLKKDQRTLYRYVKDYSLAAAWASRMGRADGLNYDWYTVLALCRKPKQSGMFPSFSDEVKKVIRYIWFHPDFASNQGTKQMLYGKLEELAEANKWEKIPSYNSVCRYVTWLMEEKRMKNAHFLAEKGLKEYRNKVAVKGSRDTSSIQVMEFVMGDEHTFDCWVSFTDANGKTAPIRPKLVAWIDVRSRTIMGDVICKDANGRVLKQSLLKMMYQEHGGLPRHLIIDNGKDYTGRAMTGRSRKVRHGEPEGSKEYMGNELAFDDETIGFYRSIGIEDDRRALPHQPWDKAQIERAFGTVCSQFTKWMASYTGTLTGSRTSAKVTKDIQKMFEQGQLLTMDEFMEAWRKWLEKYHNKLHRGLKKAGEQWVTPFGMFENGDRYEKALPPKSQATILMLESENVLVRNVGIQRWGLEYRAQELCDYIGELVNIKYDPNDITTIYVFDRKTHRRICDAASQELLQMAPQMNKEVYEKHMRMKKKQEKKDRELLKEASTSLEELAERSAGFNPVTGGIDLMIRGEGKKAAKVIQVPEDPAYRKNPELRKLRKNPETNTHLTRNAKKALEQLKAMEG